MHTVVAQCVIFRLLTAVIPVEVIAVLLFLWKVFS